MFYGSEVKINVRDNTVVFVFNERETDSHLRQNPFDGK